MDFLKLWAAGASMLLLATTAAAATYPDCEKFEDPLAYNRCLASHGPVAGQVRSTAAPEGADGGMRGAQSIYPFHRERNGRMSATFTVEPAKPLRHSGKLPRTGSKIN